ncbi:conserved hypothetical protein [Tenacibaculum dicentrarchi]|uniref:ORC1/DEAH AAA+ ATPase domain-containing protein n=3 Tax=Tenacibaculum TaxID=104267 RepID=A0ABP1EGM8_9FLAO|nr:conserved hypothetical protein [Tenacibaculum dicentrarchi]
MENSEKLKIADAVRNYIDTYEIKPADMAKLSGVSDVYVGYILKNDFTYKTDKKQGLIPATHFNKLARAIGYTSKKVYWVNRATPQLTATLAILKEAKEFGYTRLIIGETGWGKTHTITLFARKNPSDVYVVTVGSSDNLGDLIDKVIDKLKITTGKTKSKKIRDIANFLKKQKDEGFNPQIIFDESEYMKQPALCAMKELYDALDKYCSIILIGTNQLLENLDKLRKRNKNGIPQFYRRVKFGIRVLPTIDRKFKLFLNEIEDKLLVKFLSEICDNYGELHDVLVPCLREAERLQTEISLELVQQVLNISKAS